MKHIVHLCHGFHPGNGFESFITSLLNNDGYNENTIILPAGKNHNIGLNENITVIEINSFNELPDIFKAIDPDIFIIHWTGAEGLKHKECGLIMKDGKPYFDLQPGCVRSFDNDPFGFLYTPKLLKNKIPTAIIAHAEFEIPMHVQKPDIDVIVSVSEKAQKTFKRNNTQHRVIFNGVDTDIFRKKEENRLTDKITVMWTGRLAKYDYSIYEAIKADKHLNDDCLFVYLGTGKLDEKPPSNHLFLGNTDNIDKWLNKADIFLYPTLVDSFGLSVVEAMACELPVIGSQEVSEVIDNSGFIYTTPGNCITILKDLLQSQKARRVFGAEARRRVLQNYSVRKMVERYNSLYEDLIYG